LITCSACGYLPCWTFTEPRLLSVWVISVCPCRAPRAAARLVTMHQCEMDHRRQQPNLLNPPHKGAMAPLPSE
jgi:hypothetical protein